MPSSRAKRPKGLARDLQGASQLAVAGVRGIVAMVETVHQTITRGLPATGITRFVYRSINGVTKLTGATLNTAFAAFAPLIDAKASLPQHERAIALAALNGAFGDYLSQTGNALATTMQWHQGGRPLEMNPASLARAYPDRSGKLLVLVHGLCMNDTQWLRDGHDHGAALRDALGYMPIYLRYNSGLPIATNGRQFAGLLHELQQQWPGELSEIVLLTHSMGGLVARSAFYYGHQADQPWTKLLRGMVFLGTPHHGAPLERAGRWVDLLLGISPYSAPLARLGQARSAGIQDLRHGTVIDIDAPTHSNTNANTNTNANAPAKEWVRHRSPPLPAHVHCYAIAATKQAAEAPIPGGQTINGHFVIRNSINRHALPRQGDGLVPVASAFGEHRDRSLDLGFKPEHRWIGYQMNHFDLLSRPEVFAQLRNWLKS